MLTGVGESPNGVTITMTDKSTGVTGSFTVLAAIPKITPTNGSVSVGSQGVLTLPQTTSVGSPIIYPPGTIWTSSDTSIATVDQNGVVTGVSVGSATISAESLYGTSYGSSVITVNGDQHWVGNYQITDCTPFPSNIKIDSPIFQSPCSTAGPFNAFDTTFYFDDSSPDVVFDQDISLSSSQKYHWRRVFPLGWKSSDTTFGISIPTAFTIASVTLNAAGTALDPAQVSASGPRDTVLTVTSRTPTSISGTFSVSMTSGYFLTQVGGCACLELAENWQAPATHSSGNWTATLVTGKRPQTKMNGADYCRSDNVGAMQMSPTRWPGFYLMPGVSDVGPDCQFN